MSQQYSSDKPRGWIEHEPKESNVYRKWTHNRSPRTLKIVSRSEDNYYLGQPITVQVILDRDQYLCPRHETVKGFHSISRASDWAEEWMHRVHPNLVDSLNDL